MEQHHPTLYNLLFDTRRLLRGQLAGHPVAARRYWVEILGGACCLLCCVRYWFPFVTLRSMGVGFPRSPTREKLSRLLAEQRDPAGHLALVGDAHPCTHAVCQRVRVHQVLCPSRCRMRYGSSSIIFGRDRGRPPATS